MECARVECMDKKKWRHVMATFLRVPINERQSRLYKIIFTLVVRNVSLSNLT